MSEIVEDIGRGVQGAVRNFFTTATIVIAIAVLSIAIPIVLSLTSATVSLAKK